jgi:hypothetical protein
VSWARFEFPPLMRSKILVFDKDVSGLERLSAFLLSCRLPPSLHLVLPMSCALAARSASSSDRLQPAAVPKRTYVSSDAGFLQRFATFASPEPS